MKNTRIYEVRLNPEDLKILESREEKRNRVAATGQEWSIETYERWKAAVRKTEYTIFNTLPKEMKVEIVKMRKTLPQMRQDACCSRCGGKGYREDNPHWIVTQTDPQKPVGKVCFKCDGSGIELRMEPIFFRRRVIDTIMTRTRAKQLEWANKVKTEYNPYYPVLIDIAQVIINNGDVSKLPH